jgi:hypothetical protein
MHTLKPTAIATAIATAAATAVAGLALSATGPAQAAWAAQHQPHKTPWHVTIKADRTTMSLGQNVRFTGKVSKAASGGLVKLYERGAAGGRPWRYQRNALVHRDGTYKVADKPTVNAARDYRVVMPGNAHHKKGVSKSVHVDVFRWTSLTSFPVSNGSYLYVRASVSINGVGYPLSLRATIYHNPDTPTSQATEFTLGHRCTRFRGTFGIADDSETGSRATVTALADGTSFFSQGFGLGEFESHTTTFATAPLKLRFETSSDVAGVDGLGAVGTPEVYCER